MLIHLILSLFLTTIPDFTPSPSEHGHDSTCAPYSSSDTPLQLRYLRCHGREQPRTHQQTSTHATPWWRTPTRGLLLRHRWRTPPSPPPGKPPSVRVYMASVEPPALSERSVELAVIILHFRDLRLSRRSPSETNQASAHPLHEHGCFLSQDSEMLDVRMKIQTEGKRSG